MLVKKDDRVKVVLRNSIQVDGIVESWSEQESVLLLEDGSGKMIITKTSEDVMLIKIISTPTIEELEEEKEELAERFDETYLEPSDDGLRLKKLADLRKELDQQDKKIISEKLKSHSITEVRPVRYESHIFKKPSTK